MSRREFTGDPKMASPEERAARMRKLLGPVWRQVDPPYGHDKVLTMLPKPPIFIDPETGKIWDDP